MNFIDFKKYKRFFAFGCSFTCHMYPTWANVISKEMPDAEFYNFGYSGAGNLLISLRVSEANLRFNFCETDLVMIMYSTFYREDRWIKGEWRTGGNIFNNSQYDRNFIDKHVDLTGFLIRDLALINSTQGFIKSLPCDSVIMLSSDWNNEFHLVDGKDDKTHSQVLEVYSPLLNSLPPLLFGSTIDLRNQPTVEYIDWENKLHKDPHPTPDIYLDYLKFIGMPMTDKSETYVNEAMEKMKLCKNHLDFSKVFVEEDDHIADTASGKFLF